MTTLKRLRKLRRRPNEIDSYLVIMETEIEEEQSFIGGFESEATDEMEFKSANNRRFC